MKNKTVKYNFKRIILITPILFSFKTSDKMWRDEIFFRQNTYQDIYFQLNYFWI